MTKEAKAAYDREYVAPPEPSRVPLWPTDSGQYEPHVKPEAVEGEAKIAATEGSK